MRWAFIEENWNELIDYIVQKFPETSRDELVPINGDVTEFAQYLARSHDLTFREAVEVIELTMAPVEFSTQQTAQAA